MNESRRSRVPRDNFKGRPGTCCTYATFSRITFRTFRPSYEARRILSRSPVAPRCGEEWNSGVDPGVDHGLLRAALFEILINFFERANKFFSPFIFFFPNSRFCYVNRVQNYSIVSSRISVGFSSNQWRAQTTSVAWTANLLSWNAKSDAILLEIVARDEKAKRERSLRWRHEW